MKAFFRKCRDAALKLASLCKGDARPPVPFARNGSKKQSWALLSYLPEAINLPDGDHRLLGHSNVWECREIARILSDLGYNVESVPCSAGKFSPSKQYDLVLDIGRNLQRWTPFLPTKTKKLLLLTGSNHRYSVDAEATRIADFEAHHGTFYYPRYNLPVAAFEKSLRDADACMLIGNEITLSTYPDWAREKISLIPVTGAVINHVKNYEHKSPVFLYFNAPRNIVKGLDLVLDACIGRPDWILHVVGLVERERDFFMAYPGLRNRTNIHMHGFLRPSSREFSEIVDACSAFIAPSCSEGTATSALTCLQAGLFPILSRQTGVNLPMGTGIWIDKLSVEGVSDALEQFTQMPLTEIRSQSVQIRKATTTRHNRIQFRAAVADWLVSHGAPSRD